MPSVTIGLPVYNGAETLRIALDSLVKQDYPDLKIIISDNASTDGTHEICLEYARADPRIRLIRKTVNEGPVANFRTVLGAAKTEYFMWSAADDYWLPDFVSRLLPLLEQDSEVGVAMCAIERRYPDGTPFDVLRFNGLMDPGQMTNVELLRAILSGAKYSLFIYGLFRTQALQKAMPYFPEVLGGDRQFICQLALMFRFAYLDEVLYIRTHDPSHVESYLRQMAQKGTMRKQLRSFASLILRSSAIPARRKLVAPIALLRYANFTLRQKIKVSPRLQWVQPLRSLGMRMLFRRSYLSRKLIATAFGLSLVPLLGGALAVRLGWMTSGEWLVALWGTVLSLLLTATVRKWMLNLHKAVQQHSQDVKQDILSMQGNRHERELAELRYLTDTLLHPELQVIRNKSNELSVHVMRRIEKHRQTVEFARLQSESHIREVYAEELFPDIGGISVPVGAINELTGHPNKTDMIYVCAIAKSVKAKAMFEFGTYMGRTTYNLARNSPEARIVTLNLSPEADPTYGPYLGLFFKGKPESERITQIFADSRTFDTAQHRGRFDFVFVDADHSYEGVKNDTEKALELLSENGVIVWHDYASKSLGLVRFFQEFTAHTPVFRIRNTCLLVYRKGVNTMTYQLGAMRGSLEMSFREENPLNVESLYYS